MGDYVIRLQRSELYIFVFVIGLYGWNCILVKVDTNYCTVNAWNVLFAVVFRVNHGIYALNEHDTIAGR